jgi:hypothetical protein
VNGTTTGGTAGNNTDSDYASSAGVGGASANPGTGSTGNPGRIVLKYTVV